MLYSLLNIDMGAWEIIMIVFAVIAVLLIVPFAIFDTMRPKNLSTTKNMLWIVFILVAPYLGAIVYLFWGLNKKQYEYINNNSVYRGHFALPYGYRLVCFDSVYPDGFAQKQFANKYEIIMADCHPNRTISRFNNLPYRWKKQTNLMIVYLF